MHTHTKYTKMTGKWETMHTPPLERRHRRGDFKVGLLPVSKGEVVCRSDDGYSVRHAPNLGSLLRSFRSLRQTTVPILPLPSNVFLEKQDTREIIKLLIC